MLAVKLPIDDEFSTVLVLSAIVGLGLVLHTTPLVCIVYPFAELIFPPELALDAVTEVGVVVEVNDGGVKVVKLN